MRFRATAENDGCLNSTDWPAPTLNVCQFSASFCEAWLIVVLAPLWVIVPEPPTTVPPVGVASDSPLIVTRPRKTRAMGILTRRPGKSGGFTTRLPLVFE